MYCMIRKFYLILFWETYSCHAPKTYVRKHLSSFTPETYVRTYLGNGVFNSIDGYGQQASFKSPYGLAFDSAKSYLLVSDSVGKLLRAVTVSTSFVQTLTAVAGKPNFLLLSF